MDNYPEHLSPAFDPGGGVATPFPEWWARVSASFANVPEEVAEQWLHRHWRHSPFSWLASADYKFHKELWPSSDLSKIRYRINDFDGSSELPMHFGKQLMEVHERFDGLWLVEHMLSTGEFPVPPILLDNRDGHLIDHQYKKDDYFAKTYLLIEGHRRYELAFYLATLGKLGPSLEFWIMTHV